MGAIANVLWVNGREHKSCTNTILVSKCKVPRGTQNVYERMQNHWIQFLPPNPYAFPSSGLLGILLPVCHNEYGHQCLCFKNDMDRNSLKVSLLLYISKSAFMSTSVDGHCYNFKYSHLCQSVRIWDKWACLITYLKRPTWRWNVSRKSRWIAISGRYYFCKNISITRNMTKWQITLSIIPIITDQIWLLLSMHIFPHELWIHREFSECQICIKYQLNNFSKIFSLLKKDRPHRSLQCPFLHFEVSLWA